jgi:hypothetical protein
VWRFGHLRHEKNFPEIENREHAEFVGPKNLTIRLIKEKKKKPGIHIAPSESDEVAMARFARENPQYVQNEMEFYWKRDLERKKKQVKKADEAGPSMVISIESD